MIIVAQIYVDEDSIPEEMQSFAVEEWSTPELGLLLQDGDGGAHYVEAVREVMED